MSREGVRQASSRYSVDEMFTKAQRAVVDASIQSDSPESRIDALVDALTVALCLIERLGKE
jgi:hypothetical protein